MFISFKIFKYFFVQWIVINIALFVIMSMLLHPPPGFPHIAFFWTLFLQISIITTLCIVVSYSAGYLMRWQPMKKVIPVSFAATLLAATAGNTICYYLSEYIFIYHFYKSRTDHLIDVLVISAVVSALSIAISGLKIRKDKLEYDLHDFKNKIKRDAANNSLSIKVDEGHCLINFDSLIYLSSHGKKTTFHTIEKDYTAGQLLKDIEEKLPDDRFIRIHKRFIINIKYLREIRYYEGGRYKVYLNDEDESILPVGRNITPLLKEKLGI